MRTFTRFVFHGSRVNLVGLPLLGLLTLYLLTLGWAGDRAYGQNATGPEATDLTAPALGGPALDEAPAPPGEAIALQPANDPTLPNDLLPPAPPAIRNGAVPAVTAQENGAVLGIVGTIDPDTGGLRPAPGAIVTFVEGGRIVGQARADRDGRFAVSGLRPGLHSVVAIAPEGFAALAVMVNPNAANVDSPSELIITLIPRSDAAALPNILGSPLGPGSPFGGFGGGFGGGAGGFGGGGGGMGGGGGALGALAGLAGLAGLAAALSDDNDEGVLATPFRP